MPHGGAAALRLRGGGHGARAQVPRRRAQGRLGQENLEALEKGLPNLLRHVRNMREVYGLPVVAALNRFASDTQAELDLVQSALAALGVNVCLCDVWAKGRSGAVWIWQRRCCA